MPPGTRTEAHGAFSALQTGLEGQGGLLAQSLLPAELWSFNIGTGTNAPAITYAVNGKQYVAVLVGSRQPNNVIPQAPNAQNAPACHQRAYHMPFGHLL